MLVRIGYHGTTLETKKQLLETRDPKAVKVSQNEYDWLGTGFYLWEDDYTRALNFASERIEFANKRELSKSKFFDATPAVLGVVYIEGNCLNLSKSDHVNEVFNTYAILLEEQKFNGNLSFPENSPEKYWDKKSNNYVLNYLHSLRLKNEETTYQSVKGYFKEGQEILPNSGIFHKDHIQVCLREPYIKYLIKGFFDPFI